MQTKEMQMKLIDHEAHKKEVKEALETGSFCLLLRAFFFPKMVRSFFIRFLIVVVAAWVFFKFICLPLVVMGGSMLPTYAERGFNFCWKPAYWFSEPERGDVDYLVGDNRAVPMQRHIFGQMHKRYLQGVPVW